MVSGAIGIDIGGTNARIGLIGVDGMLQTIRRFPTRSAHTANDSDAHAYEYLISNLKSQISNLKSQIPPTQNQGSQPNQAPRIGLAVPGVIDAHAGIVLRSVNLPFLENRPFARDLSDAINKEDPPSPNVPLLMTDADAATWGEYAAACGTDFPVGGSQPIPPRFAHLRIGTGIALGIVINGKLRPHDSNRRTHLPLLVVDHSPSAMGCPCGLRGCLETIASGPAITLQALELLGLTSLAELEQTATQGHPGSLGLISNCASAILIACAAIQREFMVDVISLGGGVLHALPSLLQICLTDPQITRNSGQEEPRLTAATLGDDAGVVGAALLAQERICR